MTFAALSGGSILGLLAGVLLVLTFFGIAVGRFIRGIPPDDITTDTPLTTRDRLPYDGERLRALPRPPRSPARQARRR